jgi:hypothetical protein
MIRTAVVTAVRQGLRESVASTWSDNELGVILDGTLREMAQREPLLKRANLAIADYTRDVDISSLTMTKIIRIEYPISYSAYVPVYRNWSQYGSIITLDLDYAPTPVSGTLTGTVTFTISSRSVTGSGTAFSTELAEGYLIGKSDGTKYYQVAKIVSDTSLILEEPFEESSGADTVNVTKYRDYNSCARVFYGADYTVTSTSDLPSKYDEIMVLGTLAHAANEYAANYAQSKFTDITTKLVNCATSAGNMSARITQAVTDLGTSRTNLSDYLDSFGSTMTDVETTLDAIDTDLDSARSAVATSSPGGNVSAKYTDTARTLVQEAQQRIDKARSYLDSGKTNQDYVAIAVQELASAAEYARQAQMYISHIEQSINVAALVRRYQDWATTKFQEYQAALNRMGRWSDNIKEPSARAI